MASRGPKSKVVRKTARITEAAIRPAPANSEPEPETPAPYAQGMLGYLLKNQGILGVLNLVVAILLIGLAMYGILASPYGIFVPFGLGLLGFRFFFAYAQNGLGINFGRLTLPLNLTLLLSALACLVVGLTFKI